MPTDSDDQVGTVFSTDPQHVASAEPSQRLLLSALTSFSERGFHAATTREIAECAGLSSAGVYVHYRSKVDLLSRLSWIGHESVHKETMRALAEASDEPEDRVYRFIEAFARWHAVNHELARVIQHELHALPPDDYRGIAAMRQRFETVLRGEFVSGMDQHVFVIPDLDGTTVAALSLCIDLSRWYRPNGPHSAARISGLYANLVLRMVQTRPVESEPTSEAPVARR